VETDGLTLLAFDWDAVQLPLSQSLPEELKELSPLVSPPNYLGALFDYEGLGGSFRELLESNIKQLR
jgi:hypothetical protein